MSPNKKREQAPPPRANRLLAALSCTTFARLAPHLALVWLTRRDTMYQTTGPVGYVHFPTTALISGFLDMPNGASAEVALVGREGAVGATALLCGTRLPFRTVVDTSGYAYRISMSFLRGELTQGSSLHRVMMRYLHARSVEVASTVVCNTHHSVEQRVCRALLARLERLGDHPIYLTQDMLAAILGVRRAGITKAAAGLRAAGAIDYTRGCVTVLDREVLKRRACECHEVIRRANTRARA